jgi:hypothetical protein
MSFNSVTDFLAGWRASGGNVVKFEMPGLDFIIAALVRAGVINVSVSATAPLANQATTAWLQAAVPSYSAEGTFRLWNGAVYVAATPALFLTFLEASAGENGTRWWTAAGGAPLNTVGNNGDFAFRTDTPFGVYGPKAAGAWPATPIPGTADVLTSVSLDNAFGAVQGELIYRGSAVWQALSIGGVANVLTSAAGLPAWQTLSGLIDLAMGAVRGSVFVRGASFWGLLQPGAAGQVLSTGGPGADPSWVAKTSEFPSGTVMLFQQTAAPPGWTKQVVLNDYGLRVTSGTAGVTAGNAFSTVFAQTAVGNTTISVATMPAHNHPTSIDASTIPLEGGGNPGLTGSASIGITPVTFSMTNTGGGGSHTHSVNLALSYVDIIIAAKN